MASRAEILEQITDISVRVLGCDAQDVTPSTRFSELGADSLTIVEIGEELGRRFDVYLSDDAIDTMRTVRDAVSAVTALVGTEAPASQRVPAAATTPDSVVPTTEHTKRRALGVAGWMAVVGVLVGSLIGFGTSAMVSATGLDEIDLPPINATTAAPTPTETTPSPTPTPTAAETDDPDPEPTLNAEKDQVAPGERFVLSGAFPALGEGAELQVQVREKGTDWDDFPITTTTRADGRFKTELYTSRTGAREFRLLDEESGDTTPTVKVQIG